jgi:hypothetical protein
LNTEQTYLENHVFQFDFLNDDFSKLPQSLQDIINDERKTKETNYLYQSTICRSFRLKGVFSSEARKIIFAPADTFDNVKGQFPIGFKIWNTNKKEVFEHIEADIYDKNANFIGTKGHLLTYNKLKFINDLFPFRNTKENQIGNLWTE